jgi:hypothetical protein
MSCSWCGTGIEPGAGFRVYEPAGERRAAFCRLEHVVPWTIQGTHWEAGGLEESTGLDDGPLRCARCDAELGEVHILAVSHRGEHRIGDAFCSVDHLAEWAKAGGRWG